MGEAGRGELGSEYMYKKSISFKRKRNEKLTDTGIMNSGLKASSLVTSVGQIHQIWPVTRQNERLMNTQLFEQRWETGSNQHILSATTVLRSL